MGSQENTKSTDGTNPIAPPREEPGQVARLTRYRDAHPGVIIGAGAGYWQARIPEENGETVRTRYTLAELLDTLETAPPPAAP